MCQATSYGFNLADLNGDGTLDVGFAGTGYNYQKLNWYSNQNGFFQPNEIAGLDRGSIKGLHILDWDNDGDKDLIEIAIFNMLLLDNDGSGNFVWSNLFNAGVLSSTILDFDGDSDMDIAGYFHDTQHLGWLENIGNNDFTRHNLIPLIWIFQVEMADLNSDGLKDFVVHSVSRNNSQMKELAWFKNLGNNTFSSHVIVEYQESQTFQMINFDNDNDEDLLLIKHDPYPVNNGKLILLENDGGGNFSEHLVEVSETGGFLFLIVNDIDEDGDQDFLVTESEDLEISWYENTTVVGVNPVEDIVPDEARLLPNYPNPFNPRTTISYTLPKPVNVQLNIYSSDGRKVRILYSGRSNRGEQFVSWDGKDNSGNEVASGVYYYQLKVENTFQTRKMILLR